MIKKNLIYFSVGINSVYAEMAKLSIKTIDNSNSDFLDILVITDKNFYEDNFKFFDRPNFYIHIVDDIKNPDEVCFNKTRIFDFENINDYENILYLDSDILINYNLNYLFKKCKKDSKLYSVVEDYSIENHRRIQFGFENYSQEDIDFFRNKKIYTFNCGMFLFKNSYLMRKNFNEVRNLINNHQGNFFSDQSFMNYYFNTRNLVDTKKIKKDVDCVFVVEENINYINDFNQKIYHFLGGTYFGDNKFKIMKDFKTKLTNNDNIQRSF